MFFRAETLAELLHLVTTLDGGFRWIEVAVAATGGDGDGDFLPLVGLQLASFERVPFVLVGVDEMDGLLVSPWNRVGFVGGDGFRRGE